MKNLFTYATKELSQDAFLRWLFESYEDKDLFPTIKKILSEFCDIKPNEIIKKITTFSQKYKIDITVYIVTDMRKIALFIEDKIFSSEHKQLKKYNSNIEKICQAEKILSENVYKVFYKTSSLSSIDIKSTTEENWKSYDIHKIFQLYKEYEYTQNIILKQYIEHIKIIVEAEKNTILPTSHNGIEDIIKWGAYFSNILQKFKSEYIDSYVENGVSWRWPYAALFIILHEQDLYLEIRSRDCIGDKISVRILCYGAKNFAPRFKIIKKIKNEKKDIFVCKNLRQDPKQLGVCNRYNIQTEEQFIDVITECANYYKELVEFWV